MRANEELLKDLRIDSFLILPFFLLFHRGFFKIIQFFNLFSIK